MISQEKQQLINKEAINIDQNDKQGFKPISICWTNLNVYQNIKKNWFDKSSDSLHIIKNVSGQVESGHFLAIIGASGAGKTTLLNTLTGRNLRSLRVEGQVYLNKIPATADSITSISAYVQQDDLFIGVLTVREHLLIQAHLKTSNATNQEIINKVDKILHELSLKKIENSQIGVKGVEKSISGGEMKRLAFAAEILTDPSILFCDEPTSGLDSYMAQNVISVLKSLTATKRTILATIHQPSSEVFAMFDDLLLISQGRVAFMGKSADALSFFSSIGFNCPANYNPADYYITELAVIPGKEVDCRAKVDLICDSFSSSSYASIYLAKGIDDNLTSAKQKTNFLSKSIQFKFKQSYYEQFRWIIWRSWLINKREPLLSKIRIAQTIFVSLLLGSVYWQQKNDQKGITNVNGALFIIICYISFTNIFVVINTFCHELPVFVREYGNGLYSIIVYFIAKIVADAPIIIPLTVLFTLITYWMIALTNDLTTFIYAVLVLLIVSQVALSFGYFISCISRNVTMALSLAPPCLIPLMLFGGLFVNNDTVPSFLRWIKYISWFYYGNEILTVNQWKNVKNITCELTEQLNVDSLIPGFDLNNLSQDKIGEFISGLGCILNGPSVIEKLGFKSGNITFNTSIMCVQLIVLRFMALIALTIRARALK